MSDSQPMSSTSGGPARAQPLAQLLDHAPFEPTQFLKMALPMAAELAQLHASGRIHGSLTPHEFFMEPHGPSLILREAHAPFQDSMTQENLPYLAPERIARWKQKTDGRSDLYSLGVIFYQMLTGTLPFTATDELGWFHSHLARTPGFSESNATSSAPLLQRIILKLLTKDRKERYQSANGLIHDLKFARDHGTADKDWLALGLHDIPSRLEISRKIHGREREKKALLQAFESVVRQGRREFFIISGMTGVGKTALIQDLEEPVTQSGGFFLFGKFDQLNRGVPYCTFAQAFDALLQRILSASESRIAIWRHQLREALGLQAQVIINVIPTLELIIGPQPPVPQLPPEETEHRFHFVFQKFISVFASGAHPLVLAFDDLQWADAASLKLLEQIVHARDLHHCLCIGALRPEAGLSLPEGQEIRLQPLDEADLKSFLADALSIDGDKVASLARLLQEKTGGNPLFFIQYVKELVSEKLLALDAKTCDWSWDPEAIQARSYTDNVADLILSRLKRLAPPVQKVLKLAACLGHSGSLNDLEGLLDEGQPLLSWDPLAFDGILRFSRERYHFLHDRVQQAAYELLTEVERKVWHLRIARSLNEENGSTDARLFDRVRHYEAAEDLLQDTSERFAVARLSLQAARKAKASAATRSANHYCVFGLGLLGSDAWQHESELMVELEKMRGELAFRLGDSAAAVGYFEKLLNNPRLDALDRMRVTCTLIEVFITQGRMQEALLQCQHGLAMSGKICPIDPTDADVRDIYTAFRRDLGSRPITELKHLPPIQDPLEKAALDIMAAAIPAAIFTSSNMSSYLYCKMVCCSLQHGNSEASAAGYAYFAMILGSVFGEYNEAQDLGQIAYEMAQEHNHPWKARILVILGNVVNHWTRPMRTNLPYLREALPAAQETGDMAGACYTCNHLIATLLALGEPLDRVAAEADKALDFVRSMNYAAIVTILLSQKQLIQSLQGKPWAFENEVANDITSSQMALLKFWYHTRKLQAAFLLDHHEEARAAAEAAQAWSWSSPGHVEEIEFNFYKALTLAQALTGKNEPADDPRFQDLIDLRDRFALWATHGPGNFSQKHALLEAEVFRLKRDELKAMRAYEKALSEARKNHYIQDEALAFELAARHYERSEFFSFAERYFMEARRCYEEWGALGKVHQLDSQYPQHMPSRALQDQHTARMLNVDLLSLLRATQSISSEIVPTRLSETLMRLLVESSGAEFGLLILMKNGELFLEAEARTHAAGVDVHLLHALPLCDFSDVPRAVLNFVQRSRQKVVLSHARDSHAFMHDEYLQRTKPRSVLGLPILKNGVLMGLIYLENRLVGGNFAADKLLALEIIASQAAISIENASLYTDLSREEQKLRATIEGMTDGLIMTNPEAGISLINEAALTMVGLKTPQDTILSDRKGMAKQLEYRDADNQLVPFERLPLTLALRGEVINQVEYRIRHMVTGRPLIIRLSASPLRDASGLIQGAVVVFRDVTELTELDRLKDEFLRAMAHELKTPLLLVAGYFEMYKLLLQKGSGTPVLQDCLNRMDVGINRLKALMATLVDVAVFQLRKLRLSFEALDFAALCRGLVEDMAITSSKHKLHYECSREGTMPIQGDRVRLTQVLTNLLQNAIKYSPGGGEVTLSLMDEGDCVRVNVRDEGIGIPAERQERLFQRFYRAHAESEHDYGGMGVGLFLSQEIVQAHQGEIWFSSESGVGSNFSFRLPKHPVHA